MNCGKRSLRTLGTEINIPTIGDRVLLHLAHSRASREHIEGATMPKLCENALNAQQGIIVTGPTFQRDWGLPSFVLKAPTELRKAQVINHTVSGSPFMHTAIGMH